MQSTERENKLIILKELSASIQQYLEGTNDRSSLPDFQPMFLTVVLDVLGELHAITCGMDPLIGEVQFFAGGDCQCLL